VKASTAKPRVAPAPTSPHPNLEARVLLATVHAGIALAGLIALFLAGYPQFLKTAPGLVSHLAIFGAAVDLKAQVALYALSFFVLLPAGLVTGRSTSVKKQDPIRRDRRIGSGMRALSTFRTRTSLRAFFLSS
jgi:hypothetical protein